LLFEKGEVGGHPNGESSRACGDITCECPPWICSGRIKEKNRVWVIVRNECKGKNLLLPWLGSLGVFLYTNRKKGGGAGWQGDFVEELLGQSRKRRRISHRMTRKNTEAEAGAEILKQRKN